MPASDPHCLFFCATCKGRAHAETLRAALATQIPFGVDLGLVDCMAGCARPVTVGLQAPGKASYLFGDIRSAEDLTALARFARIYQHSDSGWTKATDRPKPLLHKTLARLPASGPRP